MRVFVLERVIPLLVIHMCKQSVHHVSRTKYLWSIVSIGRQCPVKSILGIFLFLIVHGPGAKPSYKNKKNCPWTWSMFCPHPLLPIFYLSFCNPPGTTCKLQNIDAQHRKNIDYAIIPTKYRLVRYRPSRTTFTSMAEMASEITPVLEGERKQYWGVIFGFPKAFSVFLEYVSLLDILRVFHTVITSRIKDKFHSDRRDCD